MRVCVHARARLHTLALSHTHAHTFPHKNTTERGLRGYWPLDHRDGVVALDMAVSDCGLEPGGGSLPADEAASLGSVRDFPPVSEPWVAASIPGGTAGGGAGACRREGKGAWGQSHAQLVGAGGGTRWVASDVEWRQVAEPDGLLRLPNGNHAEVCVLTTLKRVCCLCVCVCV